MKPKQLQLPILIPNVWEKMARKEKDKATEIMAKMILQIIHQKTENNHGNTQRPEDL